MARSLQVYRLSVHTYYLYLSAMCLTCFILYNLFMSLLGLPVTNFLSMQFSSPSCIFLPFLGTNSFLSTSFSKTSVSDDWYSLPNYNQQDATFLDLFISTDALHVSGGSSAHHQEHKTVHTASGIVN